MPKHTHPRERESKCIEKKPGKQRNKWKKSKVAPEMGKIYLGFWIPFVLPVPISNLAAGCFFFSFSSFGVLSLSARSCLLACTSVFVFPPSSFHYLLSTCNISYSVYFRRLDGVLVLALSIEWPHSMPYPQKSTAWPIGRNVHTWVAVSSSNRSKACRPTMHKWHGGSVTLGRFQGFVTGEHASYTWVSKQWNLGALVE